MRIQRCQRSSCCRERHWRGIWTIRMWWSILSAGSRSWLFELAGDFKGIMIECKKKVLYFLVHYSNIYDSMISYYVVIIEGYYCACFTMHISLMCPELERCFRMMWVCQNGLQPPTSSWCILSNLVCSSVEIQLLSQVVMSQSLWTVMTSYELA